MSFKFDEIAVEEQFRNRLDELLPGAMIMRPKKSKKSLPDKFGLAVIMIDKLIRQKNKDPIALVVRQATTALATGVAKLYGSTNHIFVASPLKFEYGEGEFEVDGEMMPGTKVDITTQIEEE